MIRLQRFKVGDKIIHKEFGAGFVKEITEEELFGEESIFLIIEFSKGEIVKVPANSDKLLLKKVDDSKILLKKLDNLGKSVKIFTGTYQRYLIDVKSGEIDNIVNVINELLTKKRLKKLHSRENNLLKHALDVLSQLLSVALDIQPDEAIDLIVEKLGGDEEIKNIFNNSLSNARGIKWILEDKKRAK